MNSVAIAPAFIHASVKRRKNTWYSIADGNWSNPNIWLSNERKRWSYPGQNISTPIFPQVGDDVYINHTVTLNTSCTVNNLYVSGTFKADNSFRTINVNGNIQASGKIDFTSSNVAVVLLGLDNYISTFVCGTASTIIYSSKVYSQNILQLTYFNLFLQYSGVKNQISNLTINGNFNTYGIYYNALPENYYYNNGYNLTVYGKTLFKGTSYFITGSPSILFVGLYDNRTASFNYTVPTLIEFRNGCQLINLGSESVDFSGGGTMLFSTNNQLFQIQYLTYLIYSTITISGIALTFENVGVGGMFIIYGVINGVFTTDKAIWKSTISYRNGNQPMQIGILDATSNSNTFLYDLYGNQDIKGTTYLNLIFGGSGVKKLQGNVVVNVTAGGGWSITGTATINYNGFTITTI